MAIEIAITISNLIKLRDFLSTTLRKIENILQHGWVNWQHFCVLIELYRRSQSVVSNKDQKMALRAFYFINSHRVCGHITTKGALSAIFWSLLKTIYSYTLPFLAIKQQIWLLNEPKVIYFHLLVVTIQYVGIKHFLVNFLFDEPIFWPFIVSVAMFKEVMKQRRQNKVSDSMPAVMQPIYLAKF